MAGRKIKRIPRKFTDLAASYSEILEMMAPGYNRPSAKKAFAEMTDDEIQAMPDEEYKAISPFEKKACYDCKHCKALVSWWCKSDEAIEARGTAIPGCIKCQFWEPNWEYIEDRYKIDNPAYVNTTVKKSLLKRMLGKLF